MAQTEGDFQTVLIIFVWVSFNQIVIVKQYNNDKKLNLLIITFYSKNDSFQIEIQ